MMTGAPVGHCLKLEPEGKQSIHVAAKRPIGQHIEHLAMCLDKALVSRLRVVAMTPMASSPIGSRLFFGGASCRMH
jgi:hypothetical protein